VFRKELRGPVVAEYGVEEREGKSLEEKEDSILVFMRKRCNRAKPFPLLWEWFPTPHNFRVPSGLDLRTSELTAVMPPDCLQTLVSLSILSPEDEAEVVASLTLQGAWGPAAALTTCGPLNTQNIHKDKSILPLLPPCISCGHDPSQSLESP
jgi:hypothetical protein